MWVTRSRFLKVHAWPCRVRLEVKYQESPRIVADNIKEMLGLLQAIVSSPKVVSAPEQPSLVRFLPIALTGGIFEGLSLGGFLNNAQNSIFFGLRQIYVSIVVRDVDDDIERVRHVSPPSGSRLADIRIREELAARVTHV